MSSDTPDLATPLTADRTMGRVLLDIFDQAEDRPAIRRLVSEAIGFVGRDPAADDLLTVRGALGALRIEVEDHEWRDEDHEFVEQLTRTIERGQNALARLAHSKDEP